MQDICFFNAHAKTATTIGVPYFPYIVVHIYPIKQVLNHVMGKNIVIFILAAM